MKPSLSNVLAFDDEDLAVDEEDKSLSVCLMGEGAGDETTEGWPVDGNSAGIKDSFPSVSVTVVPSARLETNEPSFVSRLEDEAPIK